MVTGVPLWRGRRWWGRLGIRGARGLMELSVPSTQFRCEANPTLKHGVSKIRSFHLEGEGMGHYRR